jgi:protein required for attachment to host cells
MIHYILVADASRARLIGADETLEGAEEIEDFVHPASRARSRELETDAQTTSTSAPVAPRSSTEEPEPQEVEARKFAHELARTLQVARASGAFERLVLVAPPKFLGMLRQELDRATAKLVVASLDKEYTHESLEDTLAAIRREVATTT